MQIPKDNSTGTEVSLSPVRQPFQQRVIDEKAKLDGKIEKLGKFIFGSDLFLKLDSSEQERMNRQYAIMENYSKVLGERIAAFLPSSLTIVP